MKQLRNIKRFIVSLKRIFLQQIGYYRMIFTCSYQTGLLSFRFTSRPIIISPPGVGRIDQFWIYVIMAIEGICYDFKMQMTLNKNQCLVNIAYGWKIIRVKLHYNLRTNKSVSFFLVMILHRKNKIFDWR